LPPPRTTWAKLATHIYFVQQSKWPFPRSLRASEQWTQGREIDLMEKCRNQANCSGVCHCQIRAYDKRAGGPARALMADETSGTSPCTGFFLYRLLPSRACTRKAATACGEAPSSVPALRVQASSFTGFFLQEPVPERPQRLAVKPRHLCRPFVYRLLPCTGFFLISTKRPSSTGESGSCRS